MGHPKCSHPYNTNNGFCSWKMTRFLEHHFDCIILFSTNIDLNEKYQNSCRESTLSPTYEFWTNNKQKLIFFLLFKWTQNSEQQSLIRNIYLKKINEKCRKNLIPTSTIDTPTPRFSYGMLAIEKIVLFSFLLISFVLIGP